MTHSAENDRIFPIFIQFLFYLCVSTLFASEIKNQSGGILAHRAGLVQFVQFSIVKMHLFMSQKFFSACTKQNTINPFLSRQVLIFFFNLRYLLTVFITFGLFLPRLALVSKQLVQKIIKLVWIKQRGKMWTPAVLDLVSFFCLRVQLRFCTFQGVGHSNRLSKGSIQCFVFY